MITAFADVRLDVPSDVDATKPAMINAPRMSAMTALDHGSLYKSVLVDILGLLENQLPLCQLSINTTTVTTDIPHVEAGCCPPVSEPPDLALVDCTIFRASSRQRCG
jgi:hypothetical protein